MTEPIDTIFGPPLRRLRIENLRRFLADAGDEPLVWEAKADGRERLSPRAVREEICAFANSRDGGWLIIGAAGGEGKGWSIPGLTQPPRGGLTTWISHAADRVTPRPEVDVKTFRASGDRGPVAVVWIPPANEPPAITRDGVVMIRVTGESRPVDDPRVLSELYARGEAARAGAIFRGERACNPGTRARSHRRIVSLGAAALEVKDTRIYRPKNIEQLENVAREHLGAVIRTVTVRPAMDHEKVWINVESLDGWRAELQAFRDGAIGVHLWCPEGISFPTVRGWVAASDRPVISKLWRSLVASLQLFGGRGPMYVSLSVANEFPTAAMRTIDLGRWAAVDDAPESHVRALAEDLLRSEGEWIVDPTEDGEG